MSDKISKEKLKSSTRLDMLKNLFKGKVARAIKKKKLCSAQNPETGKPFYFEFGFAKYLVNSGQLQLNGLGSKTDNYSNLRLTPEIMNKISLEALFNYLIETDPTDNNEYSQWIINQYTQVVTKRFPYDNKDYNSEFELGAERFFEDLVQLKSNIEIHAKMKKLRSFNQKYKDVGNFKGDEDELTDINEFMGKMYFYQFNTNTDGDSDDVITLTGQQMAMIDNGEATLELDGENFIVVITHTRNANVKFGVQTNWCTATSGNGLYSSQFDRHHKDGPLYVLIKKGCGSATNIINEPKNKLQFHFETNQYMDARDRGINIREFLNENPDIKDYFKPHVGRLVVDGKYKNNLNGIRDFLTKLGYEDKLIDFLIDIQPETFEFNNKIFSNNDLNRLGEIKSLKTLKFGSDSLPSGLPESMFELENLETLNVGNNKSITEIPDGIGKLKKLKTLQAHNCSITKVSPNINTIKLRYIYFNGNKNLKFIPDLDNTELSQLSISVTDVKRLPKLPKNETIRMVDANYSGLIDIDPNEIANVKHITLSKIAIPKNRMKTIVEEYEKVKLNDRFRILM